MKKKKEIVTELIKLQVKCLKQTEKYESVDLNINILGNYELLDIALDMIGFPPDNSAEFDYAILNGLGPSGKRTDFDNLFCRDHLYNNSIIGDYSSDSIHFDTVEEYVEWLYNEFKKLNMEGAACPDLEKFKITSLN